MILFLPPKEKASDFKGALKNYELALESMLPILKGNVVFYILIKCLSPKVLILFVALWF